MSAGGPTVVTTFAGAGGTSLGFRAAGWDERLLIEWNEHAAKCLRLNFRGVPLHHGDIAALSVDRALEMTGLQAGQLDCLSGSPPCQGFSLVSGQRTFGDSRNQLFREFVRLLRGLRPRTFVVENVRGMVLGDMKLIFAEVMRELRASGYKVKARVLNAKYFGVPQSRERMIFIGVRDDLVIEPSHPKGSPKIITLREAIGDLCDKPQGWHRYHTWMDESPAGLDTKGWRLARTCPPGSSYAVTRTRLEWDRPAPTLTKPSADKLDIKPYLRNSHCHPHHTRHLTALEMMRLSSWPEDYEWADYDAHWWAVHHRIGNCVCPAFAQAIAAHVRGLLDEADAKRSAA